MRHLARWRHPCPPQYERKCRSWQPAAAAAASAAMVGVVGSGVEDLEGGLAAGTGLAAVGLAAAAQVGAVVMDRPCIDFVLRGCSSWLCKGWQRTTESDSSIQLGRVTHTSSKHKDSSTLLRKNR